MFSKEEIALAKATVEAIKKISKGKWEWKPEVGDWYISSMGIIHLISEHPELVKDYIKAGIESIPLLHWERIERVLEGMGYVVIVDQDVSPTQRKFICAIRQLTKVMGYNEWMGAGNHRQEAVMKAVIELGK